MRIAVVGGIAGGTSAAAKARRTARDAEITIFEASPFVSVGACGMPYFLAGEIDDPYAFVVRRPEDFERTGIHVKVGYRVVEVDLSKGKLVAESKDERVEYAFDRMVLATGAVPRRLNVPGEDLRGVFVLKGLPHLLAIDAYMREERVERVAVVGGGFIGLELVGAFAKRGFKVFHIYRGDHVPSKFDADMVEMVPSLMDGHGVERLWGVNVAEFLGKDRVEELVLTSGDRVKVDMVLVAIGVVPNSELAKAMGLELSVAGAVKVDEHMRTSAEHVYAAGDCTHCYSAVNGEPVYLPFGSIANRHGRVAGTNVAGGNAVMPRVSGASVFKLFDWGFARAGFVEAELRKQGIDCASVRIKAKDRAHYYPGASDIWVKLIWDKSTGRLLGGEIVGHYTAVKRIDVLSALICRGGTVEDLKNTDMAYSPPFSPAWDPLSIAANQAVKE